MEPTRVYFTVDTECCEERLVAGAWRPALGYDVRVWGRLANQRRPLGIELIMDALEEAGARGTFYVEPFGAHHFGRAGLAEVCRSLVVRGHDVQLHAHPVQRRAAFHTAGEVPAADDVAAYSLAEQTALLYEGMELLVAAGVPAEKIVSFRAGNFGANNDTWRAVAQAGLRVSSSYNPCYFGRNCRMRTGLAQAGLFPTAMAGVYELPISTFREKGGRFRHLQITAVSLREMIDTLRQYRALGVTEVTVVTHSFENFFLDSPERKTGRPNELNIARMRGLLQFVAGHPDDFRFDTVRDLSERLRTNEDRPRRLEVPRGKTWLRAGRFVEQGYKRLLAHAGTRTGS